MGALLVYIIKSALCLTLFYLFYKLLLSRETFYRFNRIALLCILCISLVLPFSRISIAIPAQQLHETVANVESFIIQSNDVVFVQDESIVSTQVEEVSKSAIAIHVIYIVYIIGVAFFFLRSIYSLLRMFLMLRKCNIEKLDNGVRLVTHNLSIAPFSWMRCIVISEKDISENGEEILQHELSHIRHRHSLDLLITELVVVLQWFSPATWLLKQELQYTHEYEADSSVLKSGIDAKKYQLLLIKKAAGTLRFNSMTNSFNHSKLKKRITMMLKERSNPWAKLRYLYVLPLVAVAVTTFANPKVSSTFDEISDVEVSQIPSIFNESEYVYTPEDIKGVGVTICSGSDSLIINLVTHYSVEHVYRIKNIPKKKVIYTQVDTPKQEIYDTEKIKVYAFPYSSENEEMKIVVLNKDKNEETTMVSGKKGSYAYDQTEQQKNEKKRKSEKNNDNGAAISVIGSSIEIHRSDRIAAVYIDSKLSTLADIENVQGRIASVLVEAEKNSKEGNLDLYIKTKENVNDGKNAPFYVQYKEE